MGDLLGMFFAYGGAGIAVVVLCGFVILGFKRMGFSLPIKIFLVVMALLAVTGLIFNSVLALAPLFVISCFLVFGLGRINLPKPALVTLGLISGIVAFLTFFGMLIMFPFYIPH